MYRTLLTYCGVAVAWICVSICVASGHGGHGYDFGQHDQDYMDDYHYDHHGFHHDQDQPLPLRRDPPPPRGDPPPPRDWPPPPPPPDRRPPPPPREDDLPILYMEDHCRIHIRKYVLDDACVYVDDSMHVELTKEPTLQRQFSCLVTFSTRDPDYHLLLHFEQVNINYNPGTVDRFRIYDGVDARKELTPARGLYGKYSKGNYEFSSGSIRDYQSSGQALTLYFIGSPSEVFGGFELLLTVIKDPTPRGLCDPGYLHCEVNHYCISESLLCNGAQNCGQDDFTDSRGCSHHDHHHGHGDPNAMFHGPTDIGLMVGCALSIVILMVVVIWLGVICMKKKGHDRIRRHYARQEDSSDGALPPDGSIVEPAQIRRIISPPVTFMEPPPLYSENDNPQSGNLEVGYTSGRFELPPPYSPLDDHDTAGLIRNQSDDRNASSVPSYSQSQAGVHLGANQNRAPTPPIRTSSIPSQDNSADHSSLRMRRSSGAQSGFRPLTGVTRQQSKDLEAASPDSPKILNDEDSGFHGSQSSSINVPSVQVATETQSSGTQTNTEQHTPGSTLACQIDNNEYNESSDKNVSVA